MDNILPSQLDQVLKALNVPKSTLALNLEISPGSISGWLNGKKHPTVSNLINISKTLNVSLDWLLLGNGPMHLQGPMHLSFEEQLLILQLRNLPEGSIELFVSFLATLTHSGTDVSLRNRARAAKTLHSAQIAMILFDDKNLILDINEPYLQLLNLKMADYSNVIGTSILDWVRNDQRASLLMTLKKASENGLPVSFECDHIRFQENNFAHTYINGAYKKNNEGCFFLATAFYIP